ncbi:hypothetical protein EVJ32_05100 [Exiguobacterium sp. SH5S4]|uniref:hypothetical protein n=1 Tax=Exiguobacterium sp. SH5S4 TaxID=2510961 RepID=UPI001039A179|nr:hypothetical protein [Exiguobacterium sp. SH5S4]TCI26755.1 hypothetical protein EVJ32_05100 [Exiguobacterium sp. SH5S4]
MEMIMENLLAIVATGIVAVLGVVAKLWKKSYGGFVPADVIEEEAVLDFLVDMAKTQGLEIEQTQDIDFLIEFGRLKLEDIGVDVDKVMLEKVIVDVKEQLGN